SAICSIGWVRFRECGRSRSIAAPFPQVERCPRNRVNFTIGLWDVGSSLLGGVAARLAQLRRFEHFGGCKYLRSLEPTPEGRHYSGIGGTRPAVILGGG